MKAQDLRIGNWIYIGEKQTQIVANDITAISGEDKCVSIKPDWERMFKPIPLTEEWLIKFGFVKDEDMFCWNHPHDEQGCIVSDCRHQSLSVISNKDSVCFGEGFYVETYYSYIKLEYVHQLQNLYHSLTGEELTINKK